MRLDALKVIVTGGASGLGAATAALFSKNSCQVAIWDRNVQAGKAKAEEIGGLFYEVNVGNQDSIKAAFEMTAKDLGRTDVVVNCAGIGGVTPVLDVPVDEIMRVFDKVMQVNLYGSYLITALAANHMAAQTDIEGERGVIINVSSVLAEHGDFMSSAYSASKGAISGMNLAIARDLATHKVRIAVIAPGFVDTQMTAALPQVVRDFEIGQSTSGAIAQPSDFAELVKAIVVNRYISGNIIPFNSGSYPINFKTVK